jgi:hypothetical protein
MSNAPNCPISHDQPKGLPRQPYAIDVAAIPPAAHDLKSVITAINAMNNVVQHITRGTPQVNNTYLPSVKSPDEQPPEKLDYVSQTWREVRREWSSGRVVNPDDDSQYVEIKTISNIKWLEDVTEHQLVYMGHKGPIGPGRM